jgi:hypothetical protein
VNIGLPAAAADDEGKLDSSGEKSNIPESSDTSDRSQPPAVFKKPAIPRI